MDFVLLSLLVLGFLCTGQNTAHGDVGKVYLSRADSKRT